jgi:hypothetical protein
VESDGPKFVPIRKDGFGTSLLVPPSSVVYNGVIRCCISSGGAFFMSETILP